MLAMLLMGGCTISVTGNPFGSDEIDPKQIRIDRKRIADQVAEIKRAAAGSFRGRVCAAASRDDDEDAAEQATPVLQGGTTAFAKFLVASEFHDIFGAASMQNTGLGIAPVSKARAKAVSATVAEVYSGLAPNADARFSDRDGSYIRLSLGLLRALCRETSIDDQLAELERIVDLPDPDMEGDDWLSQLGDIVTGPTMTGLEIETQLRNFDNAMLFTIGHELAHVALDPNSNADVTPENAEIRADLFGLFAIEALTGKHQAEAKAGRKLRKTWSFSESDPAAIVTLVSTDGHLTVFDLVYQKAGLTEPGGAHLPFDERIALLDAAAGRIGKRPDEE